jgi:hypothetical protein
LKYFFSSTQLLSFAENYRFTNMSINLDYFDRTQPSLYIPYVHQSVSEELIRRTIDQVNIGKIARITFKPFVGKRGEKVSSAVVEFETWFRNDTADKVRRTITQINDDGKGKTFKLNYDRKYHWEISAFKPKPKDATKPTHTITRPTITFDDNEEDEEDKFGPKLGTNCAEKYNTSKIRCEYDDRRPREDRRPRDERPRDERPRDERPREDRRSRDERPRDYKPRDYKPREDRRPRDYKPREDRRPRDERPRDERPREDRRPREEIPKEPMRPRTPDGPPPTTYIDTYVQPDAFDLQTNLYSGGVMLPIKKKINIRLVDCEGDDDDDDDLEIDIELEKKEDDIDEDTQALYGDLNN